MARGKASADIEHPLFHKHRNAFFSYNKRRRFEMKRPVKFERYLELRGIRGPNAGERAEIRAQAIKEGIPIPPPKPRMKSLSTVAKVDPVYKAHKLAFQGYNNQRKIRGKEPFTFEEYIDHISKPRKAVEKKEEPRASRDLSKEWEAENERRRKRSQLPLKYEDFLREWKDWI